MPMSTSGFKNLAQSLSKKLHISQSHARRIINENWILIASADVPDWRNVQVQIVATADADVVWTELRDGEHLIASLTISRT